MYPVAPDIFIISSASVISDPCFVSRMILSASLDITSSVIFRLITLLFFAFTAFRMISSTCAFSSASFMALLMPFSMSAIVPVGTSTVAFPAPESSSQRASTSLFTSSASASNSLPSFGDLSITFFKVLSAIWSAFNKAPSGVLVYFANAWIN